MLFLKQQNSSNFLNQRINTINKINGYLIPAKKILRLKDIFLNPAHTSTSICIHIQIVQYMHKRKMPRETSLEEQVVVLIAEVSLSDVHTHDRSTHTIIKVTVWVDTNSRDFGHAQGSSSFPAATHVEKLCPLP